MITSDRNRGYTGVEFYNPTSRCGVSRKVIRGSENLWLPHRACFVTTRSQLHVGFAPCSCRTCWTFRIPASVSARAFSTVPLPSG